MTLNYIYLIKYIDSTYIQPIKNTYLIIIKFYNLILIVIIMILEFNVGKNILKKRENPKVTNQNANYYKCVFHFAKEIWENKNIFVYFFDDNEHSENIFLGSYKNTLSCIVPPIFLNNGYFYLYIISEDDIKTNTIIITLQNKFKLPKKQCFTPLTEQYLTSNDFLKGIENIGCVDKQQKCNIINTIFKAIDKKVDDIVYEDNQIKIYSNDILINTINIDNLDNDIIKTEVQSFLNNLPTKIDNVVLSDDTIIYYGDNQIISRIPLKSTSLSEVAWSGKYNDLKNVPSKFPPTTHTHNTVDINDYEESVDMDLNALLDFLSDEIRKE